MYLRATLSLLAAALLATCQTPPPAAEAPSREAMVHPEIWPAVRSAVPSDPGIEGAIDDLLRRMSVEEKVGQVIQPSIQNVTPADIRAYHIGSVLNGGGGWVSDVRKAKPQDWLALADSLWEASMDTSDGKQAIPIIWGADAVHGHNNIVGATLFPHNVGLGATRNPDLIRQIGEVTAAEMSATGIDWNFSPTVAVARDDRWGRAYESWSEDPALVRAFAAAMIEGLQGKGGTKEFFGPGRVIGTTKHFLGDGGTVGGKDQGNNVATETELRDIHAQGYVGGIGAGAQAVMASYNSWHGRKMHGYKELLTDVLKNRMGFDGLVVGDWIGHGQVPGCTNGSCPHAFNAGVDMFMVPEDWKALYKNTLAQVKSGEIPQARLDDAVRRILRVKLRKGLFTAGKPSQRPGGGDFSSIGSPEHRAVARQAVRESLVLLKNDGNILPIDPTKVIVVAGDGADSIMKQTGGWTLSWQGTENTNADFPGGTSIWGGIRAAVEKAGGRAVLAGAEPENARLRKPDVAIVVYGENPYAEFEGDRKSLVYGGKSELALLRDYKAMGIPVVSVFLSGRPLWMNPHLNASDAFVAAWLPGTEGAGVADVLFKAADGSVPFDFKGKLSFSWPKLATQVVLNHGDPGYDPLFPLGFGLTYADSRVLERLTEDTAGVDAADSTKNFFAEDLINPWQLWIRGEGEPSRIYGPGTVDNKVVRIEALPAGERGRRVTFSGARPGEVIIRADEAVDLTRESNGNLALSMNVRLDAVPVGNVILAMNGGALDVTPQLSNLKPGEWGEVRIRLRCFAEAGADMSAIDVPMRLSSSSGVSIAFNDVRLLPATEGETAPCPARAVR
ncbi:MAG TPA: glycoside hydrolase family 3 N-terminal domain-containing protein [Thermoanaerobaculia bacterium]|nr:glycoside hydrolase family 3 N-terminal domain-containing protein [Thermoanaerobaculia bacterium]